jgi:hypothetical protein
MIYSRRTTAIICAAWIAIVAVYCYYLEALTPWLERVGVWPEALR